MAKTQWTNVHSPEETLHNGASTLVDELIFKR
jgi:hypothetical protein